MLVPLPRSQRRRGARGRRLRSIRTTFVRASDEPLGFFGEYMTRFLGSGDPSMYPRKRFGFASRLIATWNPNPRGLDFRGTTVGPKIQTPGFARSEVMAKSEFHISMHIEMTF